MSNLVGLILSAALIADTISNLLRLRGVERAMRHQEDLMRRSEMEAEKRLQAAAEVVESVARETTAEIIEKAMEARQ